MSFLDELNQANEERRNAVSQEIAEKTAQVMDYVKDEMMQRVNSARGELTSVSVRLMLRVSAMCGAEYEIPDTVEGFEQAIRLMGDALLGDLVGTVKAAGKYGAGVFEVCSQDALNALIESVRAAAEDAGIQEVTVKRNECGSSAVLEMTARLRGA